MFRRSIVVVLGVIALVLVSSFVNAMMLSGNLPSAYDTGLTVDTAFKTSEKPLLIEFYTDECTSCQMVTPLVHRAYKHNFNEQLTMVMVDANNPNNAPFMQLFGIQTVPALYVFDHKHMKKEAIGFEAFETPKTIAHAIREAVARIRMRIGQA